MSTNRVALAPIRDVSLNISPARSPTGKRANGERLPLTPHKLGYNDSSTPTKSVYQGKLTLGNNTINNTANYSHQQYNHRQSTSKASLGNISTSVNKTISIFKDQRLTPNSTSTSPDKSASPERSMNKINQASLAATKLKLKLSLAVYKLQKNGLLKSKDNERALYSINIDLDKVTNNISKVVKPPAINRKKGTKPSLSTTAYKQNQALFRDREKFQLYAIKKNSKYYSNHKPAPLTQFDVKLPKIGPSSTLRQLPPINKILKTPMKSSSRNLINPYLPQMTQDSNKNSKWKSNLYTDETIDEDDDGPIRESTIIAGDILENETSLNPRDSHSSDSIASEKEPLSSSPIRGNSFGTPNSFSVAKSLLQLGSGFY